MERGERKIRDGTQYDHLIPVPDERDTTVRNSADVEDTMSLIQRTVPKTLWHTEKIAKKLRGRTLEETCSNIWHFVYGHIQYKRDKDGVEQVRSPRRTWSERKTGVDCDCYTEFISSILLNFGIPHKARITKYPKRGGETPHWQHVYPIVPRSGRLDRALTRRDDYITMDCVKDDFDSEQPFLECKDYDMRLDYLDGIEESQEEPAQYQVPEGADVADLTSVYDEEELGKIGDWLKTAVKKVGTVVKKVSDKVGDGVRFINRYANPATILLRNGFLLAMKVNLLNVAGRLRYAYLTDAQAKEKGVNLDALKKLRAVKDRAETVYWQCGGQKNNLKKAILNGKGNKDKKVPLSGLYGLDEIYADADEYNIVHGGADNLDGLGEIATGTALAAATGAVAAIAAALKQVKGLFNKGGQEEQAFQSETDNAGNAAFLPATVQEDEFDETTSQALVQNKNETTSPAATSAAAASAQRVLPASTSSRNAPATTTQAQEDTSVEVATGDQKTQGIVQKTTSWIKENPGKSLLIAGAVATGGYLVIKSMQGKQRSGGVSGLPVQHKKKRKTKAKKRIRRIESIKL